MAGYNDFPENCRKNEPVNDSLTVLALIEQHKSNILDI